MEVTDLTELRMRINDGQYTHCDVLEDADGAHLCSNVIKTNRSNTVENLRSEMDNWLDNRNFDKFEDKPLDLAIVVRPRVESNGEIPDIDNLGDSIIDALVKPVTTSLDDHSADDKNRYLVSDDTQFIRILLRRMDPLYEDGIITVSFRRFDPKKPMKLHNPEYV